MRRLLTAYLAYVAVSIVAAPAAAAGTSLVDCRQGASLQGAIDAAGPGDTLRIKGRCDGNVRIRADLALVGASRDSTLGGDVTIESLGPLLPGTEASITAIRVRGTVILEEFGHATLRDARVRGIRVAPRAVVEVHRSRISHGTGIRVEGPLSRIVLHDTTVSRNSGNGITLFGQATATLYDSTVRHNLGRGIELFLAGLELDHSVVRDNAQGGVSGTQYIIVRNGSRIVRNTSSSDGGGILFLGQDGRRGFSTELRVEGSVIRDNTATGNGGGIYIAGGPARLDDVTVRGNTAGSRGGGMFNQGSELEPLVDVRFQGNSPNDCTGC